MKFQVDQCIFEKYPNLVLGVVIAKNIDNRGEEKEILAQIKVEQERINNSLTKETLVENKNIKAWREVYRSFGAKKYRCSVENLYRMTLSGIPLDHINTIVDVYNYISIKHCVPVGGDNIDKVDGSIILTIAKGDEQFMELNSDELKHPKEGEVVYKDNKEVLCRRWNWRECNKSKMTKETKNVMLVVEGIPPMEKTDVEKITKELALLVQKFCKGTTQEFIVTKEEPMIRFE